MPTSIVAGRLDGSIRSWLDTNVAQIARLPYVLVAAIDSDRRVSHMPWAAHRAESQGWALSLNPLVLPGSAVIELLKDANLFTGFDELWIPSAPRVEPPPPDAYITAPRQLEEGVPEPVAQWMVRSQCRLGVGDGDGLNFAAQDLTLARLLGLGRARG